jgi:hypothetical protein
MHNYQYGSVKGETEKGKILNTFFTLFPQPDSPDHKESEKCLSEPYWGWGKPGQIKRQDDNFIYFHSCPNMINLKSIQDI